MNEDRIIGGARDLGGKAQENIGRVTGDAGVEAEGMGNQIKGKAQNLYGQARDGVAGLAEASRDVGSSFEQALRNTIEQQPYAAAAIALGIGWLFGRLHRPL